jgi:hypothetical protein
MRVKYLPQDVNARLDEGICFYKGLPYVIRTRDGNGTNGQLHSLDGQKKPILVSLTSDDLDISAPELGYLNYDNKAYYVMRSPDRKYKQTLQHSSMMAQVCGQTRTIAGDSLHNALYSTSGERMLLNVYPTLAEALAFVSTKGGKNRSMAFHRDVAVLQDSFGIVRVYFKGEEVGRIKPNTKTVIVPSGSTAWVVSKYLAEFDWEVQ